MTTSKWETTECDVCGVFQGGVRIYTLYLHVSKAPQDTARAWLPFLRGKVCLGCIRKAQDAMRKERSRARPKPLRRSNPSPRPSPRAKARGEGH
jgi:hypothetical protein